jgi:hypothetical protein
MMFKKRMGFILVFFVIFSYYISISFAWEIDEQGRVTNIVDGDTFDIDNGERIRLADISAPEPSESGGSQATRILTSLIDGITVYLDIDPQRSYGRLVAVVYVKHNSTHYKNINKVLWDNYQPPFYMDNYLNEFNPAIWSIYVQYYFPPPPPPPNKPPIARVNGPYSGKIVSSVSFSSAGSSDSDGSIERYSWNFGDGSTSSTAHPTHIFQNTGTFTIVLEVTDNDGATASDSTSCTIESASEPEPKRKGIPGFPALAIVLGITLSLFILDKFQS